jgi:hypothetical protein
VLSSVVDASWVDEALPVVSVAVAGTDFLVGRLGKDGNEGPAAPIDGRFALSFSNPTTEKANLNDLVYIV